MTQDVKLSRRQFLIAGCSALCAATLGSGCTPLGSGAQQEPGSASTACPFGEVDDPYPGKCHRYVDANGNGICDYSESTEEAALLAPPAPASDAGSDALDEASAATEPPASIEQTTPVPAATDTPATAVPTATTVPVATAIPTATAAPVEVKTLCPRGLVDDPYPGRCRRYVDRNNNGYCDLSQVA